MIIFLEKVINDVTIKSIYCEGKLAIRDGFFFKFRNNGLCLEMNFQMIWITLGIYVAGMWISLDSFVTGIGYLWISM